MRSKTRVQARHGFVWQFGGGKIERMTRGYFDIDEGRAAAERLAESRE